MNNEYILITGATGFIGSHVLEKLLMANKYSIVSIVRKTGNYKNVIDLKKKNIILIEGNFYVKNIIENIFNKYPIKIVIHIAALRGGGAGTREDYNRVNITGTELLLEVSRKYKIRKFIFCSSVGVFGTIPNELPADLKTELNGDNDYHESKVLAEAKVLEYISRGLNAFIVRPTIAYGTGDKGFPSTLIGLIRKGMLLLPFKDTRIHLVDVNKLADLFVEIVQAQNLKNRVFIAADEKPVSLKELANLIYFHYHKRPYPVYLRLPNMIFNIMLLLCKFIRSDKWTVRILLISRSWYYDVDHLTDNLDFKPAVTRDVFKEFLNNINTNDSGYQTQ